jgi:hypothetical protein
MLCLDLSIKTSPPPHIFSFYFPFFFKFASPSDKMREEIWASMRAFSEQRAQDRHCARFYADMPADLQHPRRPADTPHDSWKARYAPDPWFDRLLLPVKALSFTVPLSPALRDALQLVQRSGARPSP